MGYKVRIKFGKRIRDYGTGEFGKGEPYKTRRNAEKRAEFLSKEYKKALPWILIFAVIFFLAGLYTWAKMFKLPTGRYIKYKLNSKKQNEKRKSKK